MATNRTTPREQASRIKYLIDLMHYARKASDAAVAIEALLNDPRAPGDFGFDPKIIEQLMELAERALVSANCKG